MIERREIWDILEEYDLDKVRIGVLGSHSAIDVCDGAKDEGYETIVMCQKGREEPYTRYFRAIRNGDGNVIRGVIDKPIVLDKFKDVLRKEHQNYLRENNVLWVPNRSFVVYLGIDEVEGNFHLPIVGSRNLQRLEERGEDKDYYWLLDKAKMPYPEKIDNPEDIDCLVMVKLHHKVKKLERGFFTAASYEEYKEKSERLIKHGVITKEDLANARIERYILGPVFNLDFFYSPLTENGDKLELLGVDWRFESSLDGHVRLPARQQMALTGPQKEPEYIVCGHADATLRESLLSKVFPLAERFVKTTQKRFPPGMIGAFCIQTICDKDLEFWTYDVAVRLGGGTNVHLYRGHPYGDALWRTRMSSGRRTVLEIKRAIKQDRIKEIVT